MANKYNPQIKIELKKLETDGSESDMDVQIIPDDIQVHEGNKPILVECNINKALGSGQQTAIVTLHNAPIIEEIRSNYFSYIETIRNQNWRVYIWAWWADSRAKTDAPYSPIFIGDIYEDVNVQPQSTNDATITLRANSHDYIMRSGPYKKEYAAETTYREIVDDVFAYFRDQLQAVNRLVIQDFEGLLDQKKVIRPFVINRNPTETLNDICRELDMVWGVDSKTMYFLKRDDFIFTERLMENPKGNADVRIASASGLTSLVNFSKYQFSFSALWDNVYEIGRGIGVEEFPQINVNSDPPIAGRINSLSINLDNYSGHTTDVICQYFNFAGDPRVILPPQRQDFSGRRL